MQKKLIFVSLFARKIRQRVYLANLLWMIVTVNVFAQSNKPESVISGSSTPVGKLTPPSAALSAGYTTLIFNDDFDSIDSVDVNDTKKSGFKWYLGLPFGGPNTLPSAFSVSGSVLNLTNCPRNYNWAISSFCIKSNVGHSFRYGYFEARIHFDPALGKVSRGFPAWWTLSTHYSKMGEMFEADHWAELDFFEAYTSGFTDYKRDFVGTVHDWANKSKTHYQNRNNVQPLPKDTDFNQWHIYGCLWTPGMVTWYFDNKALMTQKYSATSPPDPLANGTTVPTPVGIFHYLDVDPEGMLLILGSDPNWPIYVDWVRVWQAEAKQKLTGL